MKIVVSCALCLILAAVTGCGGPTGPATTSVSGKVTMDGAPLATGDIQFDAPDMTSVAPASAPIVNGEYTAKVQPGKKIVRITSSKPGAPDPVMGQGPPVQVVAKEYNVKSTLTTDVGTSEQKDVNFDVKTGK
jgi:hypothetical protein